MKASELITDCGTGMLSQSKLWAHVSYLAATLVFLRWGLFAEAPPSAEIWLIYLGVVGGHTVLSKLLSIRYSAGAAK
ncbi:hypothetical protein [Nitrosomonas halophila]|uniref:Uncharacterized protein n=1 Tax=Nitrosomonas halophila TaxID=44576 RepID=A0A1H3FDU2_9PROT|nr:hypothetical protein [Nitrosomonas halophila]SDX88957.1 hypothetical protein SAMN05421881_101159 [Nitrosomonas halophila]